MILSKILSWLSAIILPVISNKATDLIKTKVSNALDPIMNSSAINKILDNKKYIILIILLAIFVFVYTKSDILLSKFNFETRINLKAELVKAQEELKQAKAINDNLNNTIVTMRKEYEVLLKNSNSYLTEKEKAEKLLREVNLAKYKKDMAHICKAQANNTTTNNDIVIFKMSEYNELSRSNIDSINTIYNSYFMEK